MANAERKLGEARFFFEMLQTLESSDESLSGIPRVDEAEYLLSAFLNACYSSLEQMKTEGGSVVESDVRSFRQKHQELYKYGTGLRSVSTHHRPVATPQKQQGYIPPPLQGTKWNVGERWQPKELSGQKWIVDQDSKLYFSVEGESKSVIGMCQQHLKELDQFISDCRSKLSSASP